MIEGIEPLAVETSPGTANRSISGSVKRMVPFSPRDRLSRCVSRSSWGWGAGGKHGHLAHAGRRRRRCTGWLGRISRRCDGVLREHADRHGHGGQPTPLGLMRIRCWRSTGSPQQLFFRVGLPAAGKPRAGDEWLRRGADTRGRHGDRDCPVSQRTGRCWTALPVSQCPPSGDTLVLTVSRSEQFQYPIEVDPQVVLDEHVTGYGGTHQLAFFARTPAMNIVLSRKAKMVIFGRRAGVKMGI